MALKTEKHTQAKTGLRRCSRLLGLASLLALMGCAANAPAAAGAQAAPSSALQTQVVRTVIEDQRRLAQLPVTRLSANFVDRVIHDLPVQEHLAILKGLDPDALAQALDDDHKRLSFWINIYNGYAQYFLKQDPSLYKRDRSAFFAKQQIEVAGYTVAMEEIEHGVLRRGATIWSLGHVRFLAFRSEFTQRFAVDQVDPRIHFALNCGARSCPPVVAYQAAIVDEQLDANSQRYLRNESRYDAASNEVHIPVLLLWFSADFGSREDKRQLLRKYGVIPGSARPSLKYLDYDWSIAIENYAAFPQLQP